MRATRAYIAGFGTAGSLLAGAAIVFVLASAVVAFRGWPQISSQSPVADVALPANSDPAPSAASRRLFAAAATVASAASGASTGSATVAHGAAPQSGGANFHASPQGQTNQTTYSIGPATTPNSGTQSGCGSCGAPAASAPTSGNPVGTTLQGTTSSLGNTVSKAGQNLGSTVKNLVGTVANKLSGPLGNVLGNTGNVVGNAVAQAGNTVGGLLSGTGNLLNGLTKH